MINEIRITDKDLEKSEAELMEGIDRSTEQLNAQLQQQSAVITQSSAAVEEMIGNFSAITGYLKKNRDLFSSLNKLSNEGKNRMDSVEQSIDLVKTQAAQLADANNVNNRENISLIGRQINRFTTE